MGASPEFVNLGRDVGSDNETDEIVDARLSRINVGPI
jgi:hypothetical protein